MQSLLVSLDKNLKFYMSNKIQEHDNMQQIESHFQ
jgi:hypothetical protein